MKLTITYRCPECESSQKQDFDFETADSGTIKFACQNCGFANELSWTTEDEESGEPK